MNIENIVVQKLKQIDLETLIRWAANEGWNPGKHDAKVFWETDPDGFYGCFFEDKLIAGGSLVSYNHEFGFMGLFIVHSDFRNTGIGRKLWHFRRDMLLSRLKPNSSIGMDGVLDMQPFYRKGGFNIAYRDERYELLSEEFKFSNHISPIELKDFDAILEYDIKYFCCSRSKFLKGWLFMPESNAIKYKKDNEILGYAVIRKAETGFKIGPLFANNVEIAEELLLYCLSAYPNQSVFLDIPTTNNDAVSLVKKYGGKYVFECARMYYGKVPNTPINNIYGITTFELG
jgi:GNAT superfamily N-acetyltransferase